MKLKICRSLRSNSFLRSRTLLLSFLAFSLGGCWSESHHWTEAQKAGSPQSLLEFTKKFPQSKHVQEAAKRIDQYVSTKIPVAMKQVMDKQFEAAENLYKTLQSLRPDDPLILNNLAATLFVRGRVNEAVSIFESALQHADSYKVSRHVFMYVWTSVDEKFSTVLFFQPDAPTALSSEQLPGGKTATFIAVGNGALLDSTVSDPRRKRILGDPPRFMPLKEGISENLRGAKPQ